MFVEPPHDIEELIRRALHRQIHLPEFSQPVYIEAIEAVEDLLSISVRTRDGKVDQTIVPVVDLVKSLEQIKHQENSPTVINSSDFFLLIEAARIRLAYSFDPFFAVSMSGVQALPHQLQAVYER